MAKGEIGRRTVTITVRADRGQWDVIDRAAAGVGKSRAEFVLDAALSEAASSRLIQRVFMLDARRYRRFVAALDRFPAENPKLRRLLATRAPWEL